MNGVRKPAVTGSGRPRRTCLIRSRISSASAGHYAERPGGGGGEARMRERFLTPRDWAA
ncbi:hypothetical protein [Actinoplanes sp. NPDC048796]|uniref:hypothetical protein n=1 Tax=Actinoplanes sp. NPDC048796 TaxID=3155640 RepID=UPI0033C52804